MTWTFHLRDDCFWVNIRGEKQGVVIADDFAAGLEWVLNYVKNEASSLQIAIEYVDGARAYQDYTMEIPKEEALALTREDFLSRVGIEIPDDLTVVYHLNAPCVYFPSVVSTLDFYPVSRKHIEEVGIDAFRINSIYTAWYNGPYIMTEFIPKNEMILDPNPLWWGNDEYKRFLSVTLRNVESSAVALQLYKTGESDQVELYDSQVRTIENDPDGPYYSKLTEALPDKYIYPILFNYYKFNEDGTEDENWNRAAANENFRLSWYYGFDYMSLLKVYNYLDPLATEVQTITPENLCRKSDGTDYRTLVLDRLGLPESDGEHLQRLDTDKYEMHRDRAVRELKAQGVEFPINVDYYILASDQAALDDAMILKSCIQTSFGDDYIRLNIKTYVSSYYQEVRRPQKESISFHTWGADFGDPSSILYQYKLREDNAYIGDSFLHLNQYTEEDVREKPYLRELFEQTKTYDALYEKAAASEDIDERYELFADAEAYLIRHALIQPLFRRRGWMLTKIDPTSVCALQYGVFSWRYVDLRTDEKGYDNSVWKEAE